ncbi:hypothetical protein FPQ18DRAFT_399266, partial [Pyronema domesticum]
MARRRKKPKLQPPPPQPAEISPPDFETQEDLHEWMLHNTLGNDPNELYVPGYWKTREAYTRYGHWIDAEDNAEQLLGRWPLQPIAYELLKVDLGRFSAILDMEGTRDVCCKGHEYLPVAQGMKKRKRAQRAKEKREAKR